MNNSFLNRKPLKRPFPAGHLLVMALWLILPGYAGAALTLERAVALAQENDPWLLGDQYQQQAVEALGVSAGSLPDPMLSVGFANLPTDTFDFDQEAMTQFKVGVSQVFPRGDSRALKQKQLQLEAGQHPYLREDRRARVAAEVSGLWLEAYRANETIRLIEQDRSLFEHLVDVAQSSYSTARGRARQQDLIRAQLELTRLEDRLTRLDQQFAMSTSRLGEWLPDLADTASGQGGMGLVLPDQLPDLEPVWANTRAQASEAQLAAILGQHPAMLTLLQKIEVSEAGIELAQQKYKPQWRVNASYGYRDDDPMGNDRADFFSVGVAIDLPLFTSSRQDQQVQSAIARSESTRTDRALALRRMMAGLDTQRSRLQRLEARRNLYESRLLQEMHDQAEASLTAYTNDDGDFSEVVRARIDVLNARIDALNIEVERLKAISQLNYYLAQSEADAAGGVR